jgi:hypothetical protein
MYSTFARRGLCFRRSIHIFSQDPCDPGDDPEEGWFEAAAERQQRQRQRDDHAPQFRRRENSSSQSSSAPAMISTGIPVIRKSGMIDRAGQPGQPGKSAVSGLPDTASKSSACGFRLPFDIS